VATKSTLTDCAKEVISAAVPLEEGLSVSQPTKAMRPCSVCSILSFVCKSVIWVASCSVVYNSEGTLVRYNGKHLADNNSQYQTNIVLQLSDNETVKNATNALTN
jgi:hypothetical protein